MNKSNYIPYIPTDKNLAPEWVQSLSERGEREVYTGARRAYVAMPCGGIGAGHIEIHGDGRLGSWWIFNQSPPTNRGLGYANGGGYLKPALPEVIIEHGFAVQIHVSNEKPRIWHLDDTDFDDIRFIGEYPIAELDYRSGQESPPLRIRSEVFSPFIPLHLRDSANPVVVLRFHFENTSSKDISLKVGGFLQNAVFKTLDKQTNKVQTVTPGAGETWKAPDISSYVEHLNRTASNQLCTCVLLDADKLASRDHTHPQCGNLAIGILEPDGLATTDWKSWETFFSGAAMSECKRTTLVEKSAGAVGTSFDLAPGESRAVTFAIAWYFPNLYNHEKGCPGRVGRLYNNWYRNATEVIDYLAANFERLYATTRLFRATYHDTTIPYWLANRISMPLSTLACDNIAIWENGRMYAYEGVNFCIGTCGHVYNFVTAIAALFPELERSVRRLQDLAHAYDPESGRINFRGADGSDPTASWAYASDAQAGYVLKLYREHLRSPDNQFLNEVWPKVKRIIGFLIFHDGGTRGIEPNGVLEDLQTFWDPMWYGPNPYNNTLYLAALRAAEEMARLKNEPTLAERYHGLFEKGRTWMNEYMWNGEYYQHLYPAGFQCYVHSDNGVVTAQDEQANAKGYIDAFLDGKPHYLTGGCCDAQQLFGQNWAHQLGLGYILTPDRCRQAVVSIFRYNWTPDISLVYDRYPPKVRTLAVSGEAALVNGSWPKTERHDFENVHDKDDVWSGLEYEAACDMINVGLVEQALVVLRSIHDRYDGVKRNPWNEIEGAEHYSRAMHSWNVLLALSGFTYDGPAAKIGFSPKMTPRHFKCFFSGAEGWGSFAQTLKNNTQFVEIRLECGQLRLKEISLSPVNARTVGEAIISCGGRELRGHVKNQDGRIILNLERGITIMTGERLHIQLQLAE